MLTLTHSKAQTHEIKERYTYNESHLSQSGSERLKIKRLTKIVQKNENNKIRV